MPYIIAIIAIVIIGVGFTLFQTNNSGQVVSEATTSTLVPENTTTTETPSEEPLEVTGSANSTGVLSDYENGTYTTSVTYQTPKRDEYGVAVSLTLTNDIVTDAKVVYSNGAENDPNAARFEAAYKTEVIGKDIDTLNLARVGGASLTTAAFNNALVNIKADAKS